MTFQYINPYYIQQPNLYLQPQMQPQLVAQNSFATNPYQASFYSHQGMIWPYNFFLNDNNISQGYIQIGQIPTPTGEIANLFRLDNGHEVAIIQRKNSSSIVQTFVDAGSMNETDDKRGIQHVIEHGLFKGSSKLNDGDVFKLVGKMGANTNACTDYAIVNYYIHAPYMNEESLKETIKIQGDMVYNPIFDKNAMESEKGPICSELSMMNDDPATIGYDRVIRNLFQINSNSKNLVGGSIATVKAMSVDDMHNYHQTYYSPENLNTVIIASDEIPLKNIIDSVSLNFRKNQNCDCGIPVKKETLTPINCSIRQDFRSSKTNFTTIFTAFSGPKPIDSKDFIIHELLSCYLAEFSTSDLKNNLEDLNSTFYFDKQKVGLKQDDPYALVGIMQTNPNDEQKCLDNFYDAIKKLQNVSLNDEDLLALKNNLKKDAVYFMHDSKNNCDTLGDCLRNNSLDYYTNYNQILDSITKEDVSNFAKKYYDLNKISIVVVHPTSVSESDIKKNYNNSKYSKNSNSNNQISFGSIKNTGTQDVQQYKLLNNTHLVLNDNNSDFCVFNWSINMPPVKPKNPNIPAVLRYMFKKGSEYKNQNEIERFKELNAIDSSVFVNGRCIEINANCLSENCEKTLALMNELMYHPKLTQKDFEAGKKYVKTMLEQSSKDASSNLLDRLYPDYFPTDAQMLKSIDELTLDDVKEFYNELLKNASSSFVATAPLKAKPYLASQIISHQSMPNIIFKETSPKLTPIFQANPETRVIYDTDDLNQAQIYQSYQFPLSGNIEDEVKFEMVHTILGASPDARLFSDLREKQNLAYSVSSSIQQFENTGVLTMQIQTTTDDKESGVLTYDNVKKSIDGFNKHKNLLCSEYVSDEELESAKTKLKQKIMMQCQNPLYETDLLAMNVLEPYGIKRIDKYIEAIDKITKEDIKQASNFIFSYNPTISVLASPDTIKSQMPYLLTLGNVETV